MKVISNTKLKELLKNKEPKQIIYMYTMFKISLSSKQLDYLINLKNAI